MAWLARVRGSGTRAILVAVVVTLGVHERTRATVASRGSGSAAHLIGPGVIRFWTDTNFVERARYIMRGEMRPDGLCVTRDSTTNIVLPEGLTRLEYPVTLTVEHVSGRCDEMRAVGYFRSTRGGGMPTP